MNNQKQFIIKQLKENGRISRNFCLSNFISRLASYIIILKREGWEFGKPETKNGDCVYFVTKSPVQENQPQNSPYLPRSEAIAPKPDMAQSALFNLPQAPIRKRHYDYE